MYLNDLIEIFELDCFLCCSGEGEEKLSMKFRNYVPHDKNLQEGKLAPAVLPKFEDPVSVPEPEEKPKEVSSTLS